MVRIDASVRLILLQFSFSRETAVPALLWQRNPERPNERKRRETGRMVVEPTPNCSLAKFVSDILGCGYELVEAFHQQRIDPKDPAGKRKYHIVRYVFVRQEYLEEIQEGFKRLRPKILEELQETLEETMWRVRVFANPFFSDGEEIPGQSALSVNLEVRTPLIQNGKPVTMWQKDADGNRVGSSPVPIKPEHCLRLEENSLQIS